MHTHIYIYIFSTHSLHPDPALKVSFKTAVAIWFVLSKLLTLTRTQKREKYIPAHAAHTQTLLCIHKYLSLPLSLPPHLPVFLLLLVFKSRHCRHDSCSSAPLGLNIPTKGANNPPHTRRDSRSLPLQSRVNTLTIGSLTPHAPAHCFRIPRLTRKHTKTHACVHTRTPKGQAHIHDFFF